MSAAEALPPVPSPWRDSSHITDHIPTAAELAACPPVDPSVHERQRRFLSALATQAAWRPANVEEADFLDALYQAKVDQAFIEHAEHVRDWPPVEPEAWS